MFYYVQDGDDHWEVLGPENVIPGDNIFGIPTDEELEGLSDEEQEKKLESVLPEDFKIIVSPERYQDFINDPNWMVYQEYIEPEEFNPNNSDMNDFSLGGLTYGYMTSPGGIMQTSQTVSQDVSWWTFPRIAIEVLIDIASLGGSLSYSTELSSVEKMANLQTLRAIPYVNVAGNEAVKDGVLTEVAQTYAKKVWESGLKDFLPLIGEDAVPYKQLIKGKFLVDGVLQVIPKTEITLFKRMNKYMSHLLSRLFTLKDNGSLRVLSKVGEKAMNMAFKSWVKNHELRFVTIYSEQY